MSIVFSALNRIETVLDQLTSGGMNEAERKEFYDRLMLICEERGGL